MVKRVKQYLVEKDRCDICFSKAIVRFRHVDNDKFWFLCNEHHLEWISSSLGVEDFVSGKLGVHDNVFSKFD